MTAADWLKLGAGAIAPVLMLTWYLSHRLTRQDGEIKIIRLMVEMMSEQIGVKPPKRRGARFRVIDGGRDEEQDHDAE